MIGTIRDFAREVSWLKFHKKKKKRLKLSLLLTKNLEVEPFEGRRRGVRHLRVNGSKWRLMISGARGFEATASIHEPSPSPFLRRSYEGHNSASRFSSRNYRGIEILPRCHYTRINAALSPCTGRCGHRVADMHRARGEMDQSQIKQNIHFTSYSISHFDNQYSLDSFDRLYQI